MKLSLYPQIVTTIIVLFVIGTIFYFVLNGTKEEIILCNPNEEFDWLSESEWYYTSVNEYHYNCCKYKIILNNEGYYEKTKICKGFRK